MRKETDSVAMAGGYGRWADDNTETRPTQDIAQTEPSPPLPLRPAMSASLNLFAYLLAGLGGGLLALRTGIPAAPLAGALLGAGLVSMSGRLETAIWPVGTRTLLEIGIGTVIGTGLTSSSLTELRQLWKPAILITVTLVATGLVVGLWCSRLLGLDPIVSLLGAAPGGISGMSLVGAEFGVGAAVATLHAVRLITVLLVLPLTVRFVTSFTAGHASS
ncbi:MAG: AbrB family transcriptional regulator [Synechococcaceae cyanobacterium ELA445]